MEKEEERERIRVVIRARPLNQRELDARVEPGWKIRTERQIESSKNHKMYKFDHIYSEKSTTADIYKRDVAPIVDGVLQGFNGTVFAYGQTGSGKTHTMTGSETDPGLIPMALKDLFKRIKESKDLEYLIRLSYIEIYKEVINDLLRNTTQARPLKIRGEPGRVYVTDLTEKLPETVEEVLFLKDRAEERRHIGETNMNARSSRSHTIFRVIVESCPKEACREGKVLRISELNLVDLAGSERLGQSGAVGDVLKEGVFINQSLSSLCLVIRQLAEKNSFVAFRNSNLTRILENSIGGNSRTLVVCAITLAAQDETASTLLFAGNAMRVSNAPIVNEMVPDKVRIAQLKAQMEDLLNERQQNAHELQQREERLQSLHKWIQNYTSVQPIMERQPLNRRHSWTPGPNPSFGMFPPSSRPRRMAENFKSPKEVVSDRLKAVREDVEESEADDVSFRSSSQIGGLFDSDEIERIHERRSLILEEPVGCPTDLSPTLVTGSTPIKQFVANFNPELEEKNYVSELEQRCNLLQEANNEMKVEIRKAVFKLSFLKQEVELVKEENHDLHKKNDKLEIRCTHVDSFISNENEHDVAELRSKLSEAVSLAEARDAEAKLFEERYETMRTKLSERSRAFEAQNLELLSLRERPTIVDAATSPRSSSAEAAAVTEAAAMSDILRALNLKSQQLQSTLSELQTVREEGFRCQEQLEEVLNDKEYLERRCERLESDNERLGVRLTEDATRLAALELQASQQAPSKVGQAEEASQTVPTSDRAERLCTVIMTGLAGLKQQRKDLLAMLTDLAARNEVEGAGVQEQVTALSERGRGLELQVTALEHLTEQRNSEIEMARKELQKAKRTSAVEMDTLRMEVLEQHAAAEELRDAMQQRELELQDGMQQKEAELQQQREEIQEKERELQELKECLSDKKEAVMAVNKDLRLANITIEELRAEIGRMEQQCGEGQQMSRAMALEMAERERLSRALREQSAQLIIARSEMEQLISDRTEKQILIDSLQEEVQSVRMVIEDLRSAKSEAGFEEEIQGLRRECAEKESVIRSFEETIVEKESVIRSLEETIVEKESVIRSLEETVVEKESVIRSLEETVVEKESVTRSLEETIVEKESVIRSLEETIVEKESVIRSLEETVLEKESVIRSLEETVVEKESAIRSLEETALEKEEKVVELRQKKQSLETECEKLSCDLEAKSLSFQLDRSEKQRIIDSLQGEVEDARRVIEQLRSAKIETETRSVEKLQTTVCREEVECLRKQVAEKESAIRCYEQAVSEKEEAIRCLNERMVELRSARDEADRLRAIESSEYSEEMRKREKEVSKNIKKVVALEEELSSARDLVDDLRLKRDVSEKRTQELVRQESRQLQCLRSELAEKAALLKTFEEAREHTRAAIAEQTCQKEELKAWKKRTEQELTSAKEILSGLEELLRRGEEESEDLPLLQRVERTLKAQRSMCEEVKLRDEELGKLKQQLAQKEEDFDELREEFEKIRFEHMFCKSWKSALLGNILSEEELFTPLDSGEEIARIEDAIQERCLFRPLLTLVADTFEAKEAADALSEAKELVKDYLPKGRACEEILRLVDRIWAGRELQVDAVQASADAAVQVGSWAEVETKLQDLAWQLNRMTSQLNQAKTALQKEKRNAEKERQSYEATIFNLHQDLRALRDKPEATNPDASFVDKSAQQRALTRWRLDPRVPGERTLALRRQREKEEEEARKAAAQAELAAMALREPQAEATPPSPEAEKENTLPPAAPHKRNLYSSGRRPQGRTAGEGETAEVDDKLFCHQQ